MHAHLIAPPSRALHRRRGRRAGPARRSTRALLAAAIEQAVRRRPAGRLRVDIDGGALRPTPACRARSTPRVRDPRPARSGPIRGRRRSRRCDGRAGHRDRLRRWCPAPPPALRAERTIGSYGSSLAHHVLVDGYGAVLLAGARLGDLRGPPRRACPVPSRLGSPIPRGSPPPSGTTKSPPRTRAIASSGCAQTDSRTRRARCAPCCRRRRRAAGVGAGGPRDLGVSPAAPGPLSSPVAPGWVGSGRLTVSVAELDDVPTDSA